MKGGSNRTVWQVPLRSTLKSPFSRGIPIRFEPFVQAKSSRFKKLEVRRAPLGFVCLFATSGLPLCWLDLQNQANNVSTKWVCDKIGSPHLVFLLLFPLRSCTLKTPKRVCFFFFFFFFSKKPTHSGVLTLHFVFVFLLQPQPKPAPSPKAQRARRAAPTGAMGRCKAP